MQISRALRTALGVAALAVLHTGLLPRTAGAQEPGSFASPFLPTEHWAVSAARRLDALGLTEPGFDRGTLALSRREALHLFETAVERAVFERPELADLAVAYRDRLAEEFPATFAALRGRPRPGLRPLAGSVEADYSYREGEVRAGFRSPTGWSGPTPLPKLEEESVALTLGLDLRPGLAGVLTPAWSGQDWRLREGYAVAGWRSLGFWGGRRTPGFRPGTGGGLVLDGVATVDGGGLFLADPATLPGVLRHLGPVRFDLFLARLESNGSIEHPWFWGARGTVQPHPRLRLGVSRAAMFGGEGHAAPTLKDVLYVLIGKHAASTSRLDNQVVSVDAAYRPPLGALPLLLYVEWGFEDSAGAWYEAPGIVAGVELAAVPGLPEVSLGIEHAAFVPWDREDNLWYQHGGFREGWTDAGTPLGHPLGGHGREWLLHGSADLLNARLRIGARAYSREREAGNLYAPDRVGRSTGGALSAEFRVAPGLEVVASGEVEDGRTGWRRSVAYVGLRALF